MSLSRLAQEHQIDCRLESSSTEKCAHLETRKSSTNPGRCQPEVTIDILPDLVLLGIFECYMDEFREDGDEEVTAFAWIELVHVCQKWRRVVFESPRRLDLQLCCSDTTLAKKMLTIWPPFPIIIDSSNSYARMDNILVALEHGRDRIRRIYLNVPNLQWEDVVAAMGQPFPALTDLMFSSNEWHQDGPLPNKIPPVVPESFLGASIPGLEYLFLDRVPFPGLPNLLSSATGLVTLRIVEIPRSGYFTPEAMAHSLSKMSSLKELTLEFESTQSQEIRSPHPPTRLAIPALTHFRFEGASKYLEDLVARIDAPLLRTLDINFYHQRIFDTPQLAQFVARTPNIQPPVKASINFSDWHLRVTSPPISPREFALELRIKRRKTDWRLSSLERVCRSSFREAFISTVEHLYIDDGSFYWPSDIGDSQWPEILHLFTGVKYLYLPQGLMSRIAPALRDLAGEALPSLQNLFLKDLHPSEPVQGAIRNLVSARQVAGHPIVVSLWDGREKE